MSRLRVAALLLLVACASEGSVSIDEEQRMGQEVAAQAAAQLPMVQDAAITGFVSELGAVLVRNADTTGRAYRFYVVDSPVANAFALPGGFVFVNRGILERADDLSELAGVMAHEIGHVVRRHSVRQMARAQNANTAISLIYLLLNRTPGAAEQTAVQVGGGLWLAKHSREAEAEADDVGLSYLAHARIDPNGMPRFFEKLLAEERTGPRMVIRWISDHPLTEDRVAATRARIAELPPDEVRRAARDLPRFQAIKARVAQLPPPPPDTTARMQLR